MLVISLTENNGQRAFIRICKEYLQTKKGEVGGQITEKHNRYFINEENQIVKRYTIWHSISLVIREIQLSTTRSQQASTKLTKSKVVTIPRVYKNRAIGSLTN